MQEGFPCNRLFEDSGDVVSEIVRQFVISPGADVWDINSEETPSPRMVTDYISKSVGLGVLHLISVVQQCGAASLRKYHADVTMGEFNLVHHSKFSYVRP